MVLEPVKISFKITEAEQRANALAELNRAKAEREAQRKAAVNSYGILNRRVSRTKERLEYARKNCTCGAIKRGEGWHAKGCGAIK